VRLPLFPLGPDSWVPLGRAFIHLFLTHLNKYQKKIIFVKNNASMLFLDYDKINIFSLKFVFLKA
jgi:hypothetical protein